MNEYTIGRSKNTGDDSHVDIPIRVADNKINLKVGNSVVALLLWYFGSPFVHDRRCFQSDPIPHNTTSNPSLPQPPPVRRSHRCIAVFGAKRRRVVDPRHAWMVRHKPVPNLR